MPLPWKKNKVPRISQIVADFHSPPKRGGSFVVETGFPTSLIDLFVKNQSRFKKRKSKKPLHREISDTLPPPPAPPPSPPSPSGSTNSLEAFAEPSRIVAPSLTWSVTESDVSVNPVRVINRAGESDDGSYESMVVVSILKVLAVVVLTMSFSVKKLTPGITVSAFALLFLEYAGKHVVCRLGLKPCLNADKAFRSLAQRVSCSFWFLKIASQRSKNYDYSEQQEIVHEEIKIVEGKTNFSGPELDCLEGDKKWVCPEMEGYSKGEVEIEIPECTTSKVKRSGKLRSKMMNMLVPRKLRASKKDKKLKNRGAREAESSSEISNTVEGDKSARFGIEEKKNGDNTAPLMIQKDEEGNYDGIACSKDSTMAKEVGGSKGYTILILIALTGLVGGRILALLFTVAWCFMLKGIKTRERSVNASLY